VNSKTLFINLRNYPGKLGDQQKLIEDFFSNYELIQTKIETSYFPMKLFSLSLSHKFQKKISVFSLIEVNIVPYLRNSRKYLREISLEEFRFEIRKTLKHITLDFTWSFLSDKW